MGANTVFLNLWFANNCGSARVAGGGRTKPRHKTSQQNRINQKTQTSHIAYHSPYYTVTVNNPLMLKKKVNGFIGAVATDARSVVFPLNLLVSKY